MITVLKSIFCALGFLFNAQVAEEQSDSLDIALAEDEIV
jgi:hypothetical protein